MVDLLKTIFDQIVQENWLKTINKAVDKYNRIKEDLDIQAYTVNKLLERYKEIYGEDLRTANNGIKL